MKRDNPLDHDAAGVDMRVEYLEAITIRLPAACHSLALRIGTLIGPLLHRSGDTFTAIRSHENFLPSISFNADSDEACAKADFTTSTNATLSVHIKDIAGLHRTNPLPYTHLEVDDVGSRFASSGLSVVGLDHIGFNLPWHGGSLHPAMLELRTSLKASCLYHCFPTGEPWDFIIPGDKAEISRRRAIDYNQMRKPKFEVVSFEKASTPLVQIDLATSMTYEQISGLFPEALQDPIGRNAWIYIRNASDIDLCLVLRESTEGDWSSFFKGHRIE